MQVRVHSKLLPGSANNTPAPHNMRKHGLEEKTHNFALLHGQTPKSVFETTNENLLLLLLH